MMAFGFIVLLLSTELVLSLPDEMDSASFVATFYAGHRAIIVILQIVGFVAAALLGGYAWRLRSVDRVVGGAGLVTAVCALVPGVITLVIAVVADPAKPAAAGRWNSIEPRGDDILFVGIFVFASAVVVRLGRRLPALGVLAGVVALSCLARLILEAGEASRCARIGGTAVVPRAGGRDGHFEPARDFTFGCASAAGSHSVIAPRGTIPQPTPLRDGQQRLAGTSVDASCTSPGMLVRPSNQVARAFWSGVRVLLRLLHSLIGGRRRGVRVARACWAGRGLWGCPM